MKVGIKQQKVLSTSDLITTLRYSFGMYASQNAIHKHPSVFLQGQPGVGKSQSVYQLAKELEFDLNKNVIVTDIRLLLFNPVDLRGIPVPDKDAKTSTWLRPEVLQLDSCSDSINILFMDEITSAPSSLQAAAYQIALERRIGEHLLPDNTFIIAAGNRKEDNSITFDMPVALRNRFIHFELDVNLNEWLIWANKNDIHPHIIEFLDKNPDKFVTSDFDTTSNIIVTPRSWEILSNMLHMLNRDVIELEPYIGSVIGVSLTTLFLKKDGILDIESILNGEMEEPPSSLSDLQYLTDTIYGKLNIYAQQETIMNNILSYMNKIPMDFAMQLFQKILMIKELDYDITNNDNYKRFIVRMEDIHEFHDRKSA